MCGTMLGPEGQERHQSQYSLQPPNLSSYIFLYIFSTFLIHNLFLSFHPNINGGNMSEKNATLVLNLHKCQIFERSPPSMDDILKEMLNEEELASKVQGNEKFKLKNLEVNGFYADLYFDVKGMQELTFGDLFDFIDYVQADDKRIDVSFKFVE